MADIAFKRDIDKKLAKRLGWDIKKVEANTTLFFKRLKKVMADPEIDEIIINPIGTMYTKAFAIQKRVETALHFNETPKKRLADKYERYKKIFKGVSQKFYMKHHSRPRITNWYFTKQMNFKQLEEFQNGENK